VPCGYSVAATLAHSLDENLCLQQGKNMLLYHQEAISLIESHCYLVSLNPVDTGEYYPFSAKVFTNEKS